MIRYVEITKWLWVCLYLRGDSRDGPWHQEVAFQIGPLVRHYR